MSTFKIQTIDYVPKKVVRQSKPSSVVRQNAVMGNKLRDLFAASGGNPTQEIVRLLFDYEPETGVMTRKIGRSGCKGQAGEKLTRLNDNGYLCVRVGSQTLPVHRVIWLWFYGYYPENLIDHVNRVRDDNRIINLREVSIVCNSRNRTVNKTSASGIKGICFRESLGKYQPYISVGRKYYLGNFTDLTEAVCHRYAAEQCLDWNACDSDSTAYQYLKEQGILK